jgi:hypothetical protein
MTQSRSVMCAADWSNCRCAHDLLPDPRSGSGLRRRRQAPVASHGHPRQTYRARLAMAGQLRRKAYRIDPTRVRRPRGRLGRGAPTQDSASLCPLLQRCENAPIVGQGRAILAPGSADRMHHIACAAGRTASPLLQNLVFGTHRDARLWNAGPRPPRGPHVSSRGTWSQFNPPDVHSAGCLPTLLVQIQVLRPVNRRDRRSPIALRIRGGRPRRDR